MRSKRARNAVSRGVWRVHHAGMICQIYIASEPINVMFFADRIEGLDDKSGKTCIALRHESIRKFRNFALVKVA